MKWLFALLLLVNLGLFLWGYRHAPVTAQPDLPAGAGIGNLRLLSELQNETAPEPPAAAETAPAEAETPMVGLPLPPIEPEIAETEPAVAQAEPAPEESKPEEPAPEEPAPPEPVVAGPPVERCGSLGVIEDRQQARQIEQELQQQSGVEVSLEEEVKQTQLGFWVVIPPLPDNEAAQQKLQELAAAGITDVWHFKNGDMKNAISLGMFSQEANANNFQREMQQRGFDTELRPRYLNKKQYTIQVRIRAPQAEADAAWRRIKQQYPDLHLTSQACGRIASP